MEIIHLNARDIRLYHEDVLGSGLSGERSSIEGLCDRIASIVYYSNLTSVADIAAAYADTIAKGHAFNDGNKRTAMTSMVSFININHYRFLGNTIELADKIIELANTNYNRTELSQWIQARLKPDF